MLLLTGVESYGQTLAKHNWYFGSTQRSIRFNRVTNSASLVTNKAIPFGAGGSAVATDRGTGNLLFYTDGNRIFDANHAQMPNGAGLNGNAAGNQPVAICPVPGQTGKYFVFTNTADFNTGGSISYSIVDMNLFGASAFPSPAFGDVAAKNVAIPTLTGVAEGMITLPHANGNDFWLITQNVNSLLFNATLINAASFTANTFNTIVSTSTSIPTTIAHFGYHEGLRKLAAASQDPNTDALILNFFETNGNIVFDRFIFNSAVASTTNQAIYDIEWSPSGQYLYLSRHGETGAPVISGDVLQYDYLNSTTTLASVLPSPVFRSYGLQRGPDNFIYHLYQSAAAGSPFLLGRIEQPDSVASKTAYNLAPASFTGLDFGGKQFPGFVPKDTINLNLDFTTAGSCQNSPTTFFPFVRPGADSLHWDLGNGTTVAAWSPIYTYATSGTFHVTLRAFYQGSIDSVAHDVVIKAFALTLQMTTDTTACKEEFPPPRGSSSPKQFSVKVKVQGGTPASYVWSNGDLGDTLTPDSAGYYYVVVSDAAGCSAYAPVNVKEYGLQTTKRNKWYFGNKAGIDFTPATPVALNESAMDAPEGCAIACDKNGDQIFYTDGSTVWGKTHNVIATGIGGNPASTQSSIIVPVPDDETIYYIFTTQAINGSDSLQLNYSMFDIKANAGVGAIVKQGVLLYMKSGERLTANGQWLIVHELGNSTFRSYPISGGGLGNPIYTSIGTDHSLAIKENGESAMKLGPRDIVAVPISTPTVSNNIEIFHLNDSTGTLSQYQNINLNEPNGQIYGVEFSPAGNKLFAGVKYAGGTSAIYEYSIDSLFRPRFRQRIPVAAELGSIQIAPNGQIYVAVNNSGNNTSLGVIAANEDTLATSSFNLSGFALAGGTNSRLGLPNFIQQQSSAIGGPGITVTGLCSQDSTRFSGSPRDQIDMFSWSVFRAPGGAFVSQSTQASFALMLTPGDYEVTLTLTNRCDTALTMRKLFTITAPPANPSRGVPLCNTPSVVLDANPTGTPNLSYQWAIGPTTPSITVSEQGIYLVDITDTLNCVTHAQFVAADSRPIFDLGPDVTVCQNDPVATLNVGNAGMTIAWTVDGAAASTTSRQPVVTTVAGTHIYTVKVTDPITTCFRDDDKTYTVKVSPTFTPSGVNPTSCGTSTGSVTLTLTSPASNPIYSYFILGPGGLLDDNVDQASPNAFTVNNVPAGTYSFAVTDQISGCQTTDVFGLSDATFTATAIPKAPVCDPTIIDINTNATAFPLDWRVTVGATGDFVAGTQNAGTPPSTSFSTPPLAVSSTPPVAYTVELTDAGGCILTLNQTLTPGTPAPVIIQPDLCNLQLTASGATSYVWTANPSAAITSALNAASVTLAPNAGNVTFQVTGTPAAGCPGVDSVTLNVGNIPNPTLAQTSECSVDVTINVTPVGTFTYRWLRNGGIDVTLGGSSQQFGLADNGDVFRVQIVEPASGCVKTSTDFPLSVQGPVDASLDSTPPCDDGQPITLTAHTAAIGAVFSWKREGTALTGVTDSVTQQTQEGRYEVEISKASCKANATLLITRAPLPEGNLPNIAIICDDEENQDPATKSVNLDPGIFIEYEWSKNTALLSYTDRVYTADSKGEYSVKITDARHCTNIDKVNVINDCLPIVNGPNAFKPGSDKFPLGRPDLTNSDFWIFTRFIEDEQFKVFVFNRWGEMVYSSTDRYFKWNGGYNNDIGRPLPPGTYSYVVQYVSAFRPDKGVQEKRGGVALIR